VTVKVALCIQSITFTAVPLIRNAAGLSPAV
jgi:hypothetical protein